LTPDPAPSAPINDAPGFDVGVVVGCGWTVAVLVGEVVDEIVMSMILFPLLDASFRFLSIKSRSYGFFL